VEQFCLRRPTALGWDIGLTEFLHYGDGALISVEPIERNIKYHGGGQILAHEQVASVISNMRVGLVMETKGALNL
jgi:hypothetical protein